MKKFSRRSKLLISLTIAVTLLIAATVIVRVNHSKKCQDIIGDGYAMGTDPKPVVIGNTCNL